MTHSFVVKRSFRRFSVLLATLACLSFVAHATHGHTSFASSSDCAVCHVSPQQANAPVTVERPHPLLQEALVAPAPLSIDVLLPSLRYSRGPPSL
jgi:hypothetical protein